MMRGTMRGVMAALVLAPAMLGAQQGAAEPRPISLAEAVRAAQENSPTTVGARNAERGSEQGVRQAMAQAFLPTLSLGASANQRGGTQLVQGVPLPTSGLPWSYGRSLSSSITLFDGGQNWNRYRGAQANLDRDGAAAVTARFSIALNVKTQYYNVLAAREQESAAHRQLEQAEQQLKVSSAKMAAGAATRADSLSGAIQVGNARLAILNAQNSLRNANAAITRLVASPVPVTALASDTSETGRISLDEDALAPMALEGPAVRQAQATLAAGKATHRSSRGTYLPRLSLNGSYGQNPQGSESFNWGGGPTGSTFSMNLNLNLTLFDQFSRETGLVNGRIAEDNAEANLRDARFAAQQNLTTFLNTYRTAQATIELQLLQISAAEENVRVVQLRYLLGTAQVLEVLTAQSSLDSARNALIRARLDARTAKANIEALIGRDLP